MDISTFLRVVLRGWWLILLSVVTTAGSAAFVVSRQAPIYSASATVLLKASPNLEPNQYINAINALSRRETINSLARIAEGSSMRERVATALQTQPVVVEASKLQAQVLPDTNLIVVRSESTDAGLAAAIANAVAAELRKEIPDRALLLDITDRAVAPTSPIEPRPTRTITLAVFFGLTLGVVFALLGWALQTFFGSRGGNKAQQDEVVFAGGGRDKDVIFAGDGMDKDASSAKTQPLFTTRS